MSDIYIIDGQYEKCLPDKKPINVIYPANAIHYIIHGQGYFNGRILTTGQGFVCHEDQLAHYFPDRKNPWTYIWVKMGGERIGETLSNCGLDAKTYIFEFDWVDSLIQISKIIFTDNYFIPKNRMFAEACAKFLLSFHKRLDSMYVQRSQRKLHVDAAKKYILSNYYKEISITAVADHLHLSRGYLRNIFFEYEKLSPQRYLMNVRIDRAKELLKSDGIPISMLASSIGYNDVTQFYRIFKKYTGISPSAYRTRQQNL